MKPETYSKVLRHLVGSTATLHESLRIQAVRQGKSLVVALHLRQQVGARRGQCAPQLGRACFLGLLRVSFASIPIRAARSTLPRNLQYKEICKPTAAFSRLVIVRSYALVSISTPSGTMGNAPYLVALAAARASSGALAIPLPLSFSWDEREGPAWAGRPNVREGLETVGMDMRGIGLSVSMRCPH